MSNATGHIQGQFSSTERCYSERSYLGITMRPFKGCMSFRCPTLDKSLLTGTISIMEKTQISHPPLWLVSGKLERHPHWEQASGSSNYFLGNILETVPFYMFQFELHKHESLETLLNTKEITILLSTNTHKRQKVFTHCHSEYPEFYTNVLANSAIKLTWRYT